MAPPPMVNPTTWCPFLSRAAARHCEVAPVRKMILSGSASPDDEKCSSPAFISCALVSGRAVVSPGSDCCPFLRETPVLFCSVAPMPQLVPYRETLPSCCQNEGHHSCGVYLQETASHGSGGLESPGAVRPAHP